ncbi:hypothetical protein M3Y95_01201000 [Aphelenchoides besseyi]|nr:hypothetical protein M3Y95_01201000 [Aphelenchoides besseyi]
MNPEIQTFTSIKPLGTNSIEHFLPLVTCFHFLKLMNSTGDSVGFDRYFYANVTNKSFYETSFGIFYRANNLLASSLGLIAICLLFYMIRYKTPTSFRPYSKLLYLCLAVDLYCLLSFFVSQSRYKITPTFSITVYDGFVSLLNRRGQCYYQYLHPLVPVIQSLLLPIFAIYRHYHIKNKIAPNTKKLMIYSSIALIPVIIGLIIPTFSKCVTQEITTDAILSWKAETPIRMLFGSCSPKQTNSTISRVFVSSSRVN